MSIRNAANVPRICRHCFCMQNTPTPNHLAIRVHTTIFRHIRTPSMPCTYSVVYTYGIHTESCFHARCRISTVHTTHRNLFNIFNCSNGRVRSLSRCAKSEVHAYTYRVKNETPGAPEDSSSIACACFPREHFATQRRRSWRWIEKCARTHDVSHNEHFRIHGTYGTDMIIGNRSGR